MGQLFVSTMRHENALLWLVCDRSVDAWLSLTRSHHATAVGPIRFSNRSNNCRVCKTTPCDFRLFVVSASNKRRKSHSVSLHINGATMTGGAVHVYEGQARHRHYVRMTMGLERRQTSSSLAEVGGTAVLLRLENSESMRTDSPFQCEEKDLTMEGIAMLPPGSVFLRREREIGSPITMSPLMFQETNLSNFRTPLLPLWNRRRSRCGGGIEIHC